MEYWLKCVWEKHARAIFCLNNMLDHDRFCGNLTDNMRNLKESNTHMAVIPWGYKPIDVCIAIDGNCTQNERWLQTRSYPNRQNEETYTFLICECIISAWESIQISHSQLKKYILNVSDINEDLNSFNTSQELTAMMKSINIVEKLHDYFILQYTIFVQCIAWNKN